jgi:deoxyribonuclease-4
MRYIGAHVSIGGGVSQAPIRAKELGATALGMFTRNQRRWEAPPLDPSEISAFAAALTESSITAANVVVHASYLINIANPNAAKRQRSVEALVEECQRAELLNLSLVNFHPGSGLGELSELETLRAIAAGVRQVLDRTEQAVVVLETTAGQGDHVGWRFAQLGAVINELDGSERVAVCIDTCHAFAAGYDLTTEAGYESMIAEARSEVDNRIVAVHLNDSRFGLGSRKDRHECIGTGEIGLAGLARIVRDPCLDSVPFILETPRPELWGDEIALLRRIASGETDPKNATPPAAIRATGT